MLHTAKTLTFSSCFFSLVVRKHMAAMIIAASDCPSFVLSGGINFRANTSQTNTNFAINVLQIHLQDARKHKKTHYNIMFEADSCSCFKFV